MKKIIRLTEKDLTRLIRRVISEGDPGDGKPDSFPEYEYRDDIYVDSEVKGEEGDEEMTQQVAEDWYKRRIKRQKINENDSDKIEDIKACYINTVTPFPKSSCGMGLSPFCIEQIRTDATSFFLGNKNAQNDPKIINFWGCINKADPTILQGMG